MTRASEIATRAVLSGAALAFALIASLSLGFVIWPAMYLAEGRVNSFAILGVVASWALWVLLVAGGLGILVRVFDLIGHRHFPIVVFASTVVALHLGMWLRHALFTKSADEGYPSAAYALLYAVGFVGAFVSVCFMRCQRVTEQL